MSNHTAKAFAAGLVLAFLITATSAYAQAPPGMVEVSGKYMNAKSGVEITFPDGWSGFEITTSNATLVATGLGGMSESDPEKMKSITVIITDKSSNKDPKDPSSFSNDVSDCNAPTIKSRTVTGVQGIEATVECPSSSQKFRSVSVETSSNLIIVMYLTPSADFDTQLASFDSAVGSLKVNGAVNIEAPSGGQPGAPSSSMMSVMIQGKSINVSVNSTSTISEFKLDEASKMLSFKTAGTGSETIIAIGTVMEGPFTVMVDGKVTQAQENKTGGVSTITIQHSSGAHEVTVSGTQVVPEFPIAMLGIIAATIGVVTVLGRTRLMKGKL